MSTAIVVFAKTLGLSPVKTRLAATVGKEKAEQFYRLSVQAIRETLELVKVKDKSVTIYWALAEENGPEDTYWADQNVFWTGEGNLGQRLDQVTAQLFETHDAVIMIGTDSPQMEVNTLLKAVETLKENPSQCVVGPCSDGGFYLFGSSFYLGTQIWTAVPYSQSNTLEQLLLQLQREHITWCHFSVLSDVDCEADLPIVREALDACKSIGKGQCKLLEWLKALD